MTHDARAIANLILDRFDAEYFDISNKKINKLIYYCHGFCLVRLGSELLRNHIEAWLHGPVVRVVYEQFKVFEHRPIQSRARYFDFGTATDEIVSYERVSVEEQQLIVRVVGHFAKYSADELELMTHRPSSPWSMIMQSNSSERGIRNRIPNELIHREFSEQYGKLGKTH